MPGVQFQFYLEWSTLHQLRVAQSGLLADYGLWAESDDSFFPPYDREEYSFPGDAVTEFFLDSRDYAELPHDWKSLPPDRVPPVPASARKRREGMVSHSRRHSLKRQSRARGGTGCP
jgi:hypothetical protein